jgi:hypothetical protein
MMMRKILKVLLLAILLSCCGGFVLAYEEPGYTVVKRYQEFELRQYDAYLVAETSVTGDFDDVGGEAFRRLFDYISEGNRPQGKIAMTTPVIQQPLPAVTEQSVGDDVSPGIDNRYRFAFVMPAGYSLEDLPPPENPEIRIKNVPARLMAARRYTGTWSKARYRSNEQQLLAAVQVGGLKTLGPPIFARYNAPFSLWFLRRNEVLVEVAAP